MRSSRPGTEKLEGIPKSFKIRNAVGGLHAESVGTTAFVTPISSRCLRDGSFCNSWITICSGITPGDASRRVACMVEDIECEARESSVSYWPARRFDRSHILGHVCRDLQGLAIQEQTQAFGTLAEETSGLVEYTSVREHRANADHHFSWKNVHNGSQGRVASLQVISEGGMRGLQGARRERDDYVDPMWRACSHLSAIVTFCRRICTNVLFANLNAVETKRGKEGCIFVREEVLEKLGGQSDFAKRHTSDLGLEGRVPQPFVLHPPCHCRKRTRTETLLVPVLRKVCATATAELNNRPGSFVEALRGMAPTEHTILYDRPDISCKEVCLIMKRAGIFNRLEAAFSRSLNIANLTRSEKDRLSGATSRLTPRENFWFQIALSSAWTLHHVFKYLYDYENHDGIADSKVFYNELSVQAFCDLGFVLNWAPHYVSSFPGVDVHGAWLLLELGPSAYADSMEELQWMVGGDWDPFSWANNLHMICDERGVTVDEETGIPLGVQPLIQPVGQWDVRMYIAGRGRPLDCPYLGRGHGEPDVPETAIPVVWIMRELFDLQHDVEEPTLLTFMADPKRYIVVAHLWIWWYQVHGRPVPDDNCRSEFNCVRQGALRSIAQAEMYNHLCLEASETLIAGTIAIEPHDGESKTDIQVLMIAVVGQLVVSLTNSEVLCRADVRTLIITLACQLVLVFLVLKPAISIWAYIHPITFVLDP
ncbi:hypothetical protein BKA62DRAFT_675384 [Auriculariales sp. MPI-PUGE-AT-0066]|nr:hypothetical protein BKA62DRAFT_675384 [Auriculariales sp. MPI-PUGE-AT-0066]